MNISSLRFVCVLQFAMAGYMVLSSFVNIFDAPGWHSVVSLIAFSLAICLASYVLEVSNKNYPDTPLSTRQRSTFNWLFMLNFLMLSVLLTYNINDFKLITGLAGAEEFKPGALFYLSVLLHLLISIFQVYILLNMVKLRRILIANFDKKSGDLDVLQS